MEDDRATFPSEILEEITAYLSDDQTTLARCSLASSELAIICRRHLFGNVVVGPRSLASFLSLINAPWTSLPPALSKITIKGKILGRGTLVPFNGPMDLDKLKSSLRRVHSFIFSNISLDILPTSFWNMIHALEGVKEVTIHEAVVGHSLRIFPFLCSLPSLERVSVSRTTWDVSSPWLCLITSLVKSPFSIPLLDVGARCNLELSVWVLAQNPTPPIETLRIDISTGRLVHQKHLLQRFLSTPGLAIQHIQIKLPTRLRGSSSLYKELVDLTALTGLQSVHVDGLVIDPLCPSEDKEMLEDLVGHLLSHLPRSYIHPLSLSLGFAMDPESGEVLGVPDNMLLQVYNWNVFTETLTEYPCLNLRLKIAEHEAYLTSYTEEYLRTGPFAAFHDSERLQIEFS
ncbi:hypothetical protein BDN72DRAFT_894449 [Pluteus cervinus]|uniref:Uncharacterized protein n=1 Tax=Pluteus cervinus TaxID=181527 RepID=A0ACD3B3C8_9AGAR|nr:hypothetical protein BDN72DRAFT_894449 [Pluteus cervinus]